MQPQSILLTGATGFVGGAIALDLLARTGAQLLCLTRDTDTQAASRRLRGHLGHAADLYGRPGLRPVIERRCQAIPGDLTAAADLLGLPVPHADLVIHCAASLKFADTDSDEIQRVNVKG